jgi:hypothetical protein
MPLTTYVGLSEFTEVVPTELIPGVIAGYAYTPTVVDAIADIKAGRGNVPVRFPRFNALSVPSGTVAETVDHTDVNVDLAESSITPAMVRFRVPISDEVAAAALAGIPLGVLKSAIDAMNVRRDSDGLAASTAASEQTGAVGTAMTLEAFHSARAAYRALYVEQFGGRHAFVMAPTAITSLEASIRNQSGPWAMQRDSALAASIGSQYQGSMNGLEIFHSGNVAAESTGWSNFITPMGSGLSGLGQVVNEMPNVKVERGNEGELRATTFYHFRMWYGSGITNPTRFLEVLSA